MNLCFCVFTVTEAKMAEGFLRMRCKHLSKERRNVP